MVSQLTVDVVIPTLGRPSLLRAIESVRAQTHGKTRPIVVLDDPSQETYVRGILDATDLLVVTSGAVGGGSARNLGLDASSADLVAFLDDDDWWDDRKLEKQADAIASANATVVFTHTVFHETNGNTRILPEGPFDDSTNIADYLVVRPRLRHGHGYMQSSSLLFDRRVHSDIRWDDSLPKHQDWDFVLRLSTSPDSVFIFVEEALVHVQQGSTGSISKKRTALSSQKWLDKHAALMTHRPRGDFIATQILRAHLTNRDISSALKTCVLLLRERPHLAAVAIGLSGAVESVRRHS